MELLVDALLQWIEENSQYTTEAIRHPIVKQLSAEELTAEFYTGVAHLAPDDGVDERLNALYAPGDGPYGTIYVLEAVIVEGASEFADPVDNPLFREIVLHELVHHVQVQSGNSENWDCLAFGEQEAYRLGGKYLKQTGTTDPLPSRNFWGAMYARC